MNSSSKGTGADYLVEKSDLSRMGRLVPKLKDILIVEDESLAGDRLAATLRAMLGYEPLVRRARTLGSALDMLLKKHPELILLDDLLKPSDTALDSLPMIRHTGYKGPIVIVSANVDRFRRAELLSKGADDTINKDDLDSAAIAKTLLRLVEADKFIPPTES